MISTSAMAQRSLADFQDWHSLLKNESTARDFVCVCVCAVFMLAMFSLSPFLCTLWLFSRAEVRCFPEKPQQEVLVTYPSGAKFISQRPPFLTVFC